MTENMTRINHLLTILYKNYQTTAVHLYIILLQLRLDTLMPFDTSTFLRLLADPSTLEILSHIAKCFQAGEGNGISIPISKTSLTRRQYYRRLSALAQMGLIVRNNHGKYNMTLFGRLMSEKIASIEKLVDQYWKIRAIDYIKEATSDDGNNDRLFIELVDNLIEDNQVKRIILCAYSLGTKQTHIYPKNESKYSSARSGLIRYRSSKDGSTIVPNDG